MATHIRNRNDLIKWLENNTTSPSIARALQEGIVENLGGFWGAIGGYWIVRVTSRFGKTWNVAILPLVPKGYHAHIIIEAPWKYWTGEKCINKLYQGDKPKEYKLLRDKELCDAR